MNIICFQVFTPTVNQCIVVRRFESATAITMHVVTRKHVSKNFEEMCPGYW